MRLLEVRDRTLVYRAGAGRHIVEVTRQGGAATSVKLGSREWTPLKGGPFSLKRFGQLITPEGR